METEFARAMESAKTIPMAELEGRARAAVDAAKVLAGKGEWIAACAALTDAEGILSAAEDVQVGRFRRVERVLQGPVSTPERYTPPTEALLTGAEGRPVLVAGLR